MKVLGLKNYFNDLYYRLEQAGIIYWPVQASALSYYSLMGLVPFLALCFVIAKGLGLDLDLAQFIDSWVEKYFFSMTEQVETMTWQKEIIDLLQSSVQNLIGNYSGSLMAFIALGIIFWSGYRILTLLDGVFGQIFGYNPSRRIIHRVMDYFTVMVIVPLVLMAALGINVFLTGLSTDTWDFPGGIDPGFFKSLVIVILPYILVLLVFSWVYAYFSRGLIGWRERLPAALVTCLVFQVCLAFYLKIMFAVTSYNAIYGSFAFIPLFMIWLYLAWLILLAGGELSRRLFDLFATGRGFFRLSVPVTWRNTLDLSLAVLSEINKNYQAEPAGGPTSFRQLAKATRAPLPNLGSVISRLLDVNLVVRISGPSGGKGPCFLPARSQDVLSDEIVAQILENGSLNIYN